MAPSAIQSLLTLALLLGAFAFTFRQLGRLAILINTGTRGETLSDAPGRRLLHTLAMTFGHRKVLEDPFAGLLHVCFLFGFFVLGVGHVEVVLEGLTAFRGAEAFRYADFLSAPAVAAYHLSQDLLAAAVLAASGVALARRLSGRVARLQPRSTDAETILYLILALYVTFFVLQGATAALELSASSGTTLPGRPLSALAGSTLLAAGLSGGALAAVRAAGFWSHLLVFLGFACYITVSKHMHLVFAWPNIFFSRSQRFGLPRPVDFEESEKFGVDRVQELPWKTLLDTFACTECGRCNSVCPAHLTGKPLQPMKVLHDVKVNLRYRNADGLLALRDSRGRPDPSRKQEEDAWEPALPLVARQAPEAGQVRGDGAYLHSDGQVHLDELWSCTTCAACVEVCPVSIDSVPGALIGLRQSLVMMESEFPQEATGAFRGMEVQGNPWGVGQDQREEWAEGLDVPRASGSREVEYLLWVGCAGATDPRARKTQRALARVLEAAGVDFAILGCKEKCTGDPARRMGNEYVWRSLAEENVATLAGYRFRKIVASCPHCFNSLRNDYGEVGGRYQVVHHTELLAELLREGRVPQGASAEAGSVTFHDPCYLGRYNDGYEPPREILTRLGAKLEEMPLSRERGFCCGAGGGRVFMEETIGGRVNLERTDQALGTGARTLAVGCPFCMTMLTDGAKSRQAEDRLAVRDLAELVADRLPPEA
jgi:Fe-S oxidoreductase